MVDVKERKSHTEHPTRQGAMMMKAIDFSLNWHFDLDVLSFLFGVTVTALGFKLKGKG